MCGLATAGSAFAALVGIHPVPTYQTNGRVNVIVAQGSTVYLGGQFTAVRPAGAAAGTGEVTRNHVAAFNVKTGALLPWNPNAGGTVRAIAVAGSTVYLGGSFTKIGGTGRARLAAVDATTGALTSWKQSADAEVFTLAYQSGTLYAGGDFTTVGGSARSHLAAFSTSTGGLTSWSPSADAEVKAMTLTADGSKVVVGGSFTTVDGTAQSHIAAISPSTGAVLGWKTHTPYAVIDLAADAGGVYVAGAGGGGNFAGFNPSTGAKIWDGGTNGTVQGIGVVDGIVYVGGHYTNYCGPGSGAHTCPSPTARDKLLAVDEGTGALEPWDPGANSALGVIAVTGDAATGDLFCGGDFTSIGLRKQQGFAQFIP